MAKGHCQKQSPSIARPGGSTVTTLHAPGETTAHPGAGLVGRASAPGDKSISHRALILGALAHGLTEIEGLLEGEDVRRTAAAMSAFGAGVERVGAGRWRVAGQGGFAEAAEVIDCGNAGTGARLIMGAAAGFDISSSFTGDASLRGRPMSRVLEPLALMGARWLGRDGGRLPLTLHGGKLSAIDYRLPVPSAQVKSAILLAGLNAAGQTRIVEPQPTRDHTERMLRAFGARVEIEDAAEGRSVRLAGGQKLQGARIAVAGDPSSAAFPLVAALITPRSEVTLTGVMINPLRAGLIDTLREMGADLTLSNARDAGGERIADITARHSALTAITVPPERAVSMIDEYPILAIAAAFATGTTVMRGIGELRVKESDRIALTAAGLRACGVKAEEEPEGLIVTGAGAGRWVTGGARVASGGDHRIAMSFLVLGLAARGPVSVEGTGMIATSFPGFSELMSALGARLDPR
jgi:3-phosphoshikimate 1-carboxyvinyltransferase